MKLSKYLFCFIITLFIVILSCNKEEEKLDETPPVLSITPVNISTVNSIIAFGDDLTPTQKNPAFEYIVNNSNVQVRASCQGYIEEIRLNDNFPDYEVFVKLSSNSAWRIIYDHILNLNISVGNNVNPGDILGTVGEGNRTELQINKNSNNSELSYCPFNYGTNDFIQQHKTFTENWCLEDTVVP
ncbi:MAG: M23 family metallopeptidase [Petrimonas sp.]|jgi:hypothetical protein